MDEPPITDAHQHFWDLDQVTYPWLSDRPMVGFRYGDYGALKRRYLPLPRESVEMPREVAGVGGNRRAPLNWAPTAMPTQPTEPTHIQPDWPQQPEEPHGEGLEIHSFQFATGSTACNQCGLRPTPRAAAPAVAA